MSTSASCRLPFPLRLRFPKLLFRLAFAISPAQATIGAGPITCVRRGCVKPLGRRPPSSGTTVARLDSAFTLRASVLVAWCRCSAML